METVSYVVGVDVCVVPLQPVIQNGDDHSFSCDAFLPHGDDVQVQLRQRGRSPRVLLEDIKCLQNLHICNSHQTVCTLSLSTSSKQALKVLSYMLKRSAEVKSLSLLH